MKDIDSIYARCHVNQICSPIMSTNKGQNTSTLSIEREGSGETFQFGRRVEFESLKQLELQLNLRLLLPFGHE
jgi:hypothetical protein